MNQTLLMQQIWKRAEPLVKTIFSPAVGLLANLFGPDYISFYLILVWLPGQFVHHGSQTGYSNFESWVSSSHQTYLDRLPKWVWPVSLSNLNVILVGQSPGTLNITIICHPLTTYIVLFF